MLSKFIKKFSFNDLLFIGALFVALVLGWNTVTTMQRNYRLQQKQNRLTDEIELLQLENDNLKYNIAYLKTNDYLELAARKKFDKALSGETLVYLPNAGSDRKATVAKAQPKVASEQVTSGWKTNLNSWWRFIQGKHVDPRS